nr:MFS transporter [Williamsia soli]
MIVVCLGVFMLLLDMTIVSAALADIQSDLSADLSGLQWVVDGYALPMAAFLLTAATLGDRLGRKRMYVCGLTLFVAASAGCALAGDITTLDAVRVVQGLGGAIMLGVSLPMIAAVYPAGKGRSTAIAIYGAVMGAGSAAGPLLGGALVDAFGWPSIFFVNIPIGAIALTVALVRVEESLGDTTRRVDILGTITLSITLVTAVYAIIEGNAKGWTSPLILGLFALAAIFAVAFVLWELRVSDPLMDLSVVRRPGFAGVSLAAFITSGTLIAATNYLALYFMNTLGYTPFEAGVRALPLTIACVIGAPVGMIVTRKLPMHQVVPLSTALIAAGLWAMTGISADTGWTHFITGMVVAGLGVGMMSAIASDAALTFVREADAGMATGVVSTARQIGTVIGIAGMGALFTHFATASAKDDLGSLAVGGVPVDVPPSESAAITDGLGSGAGLQILSFIPDQYNAALPEITRLVRDSSAAGLQAAVLAAATAATVFTLVVYGLIRADRQRSESPAAPQREEVREHHPAHSRSQ